MKQKKYVVDTILSEVEFTRVKGKRKSSDIVSAIKK